MGGIETSIRINGLHRYSVAARGYNGRVIQKVIVEAPTAFFARALAAEQFHPNLRYAELRTNRLGTIHPPTRFQPDPRGSSVHAKAAR
jgi:hypothetical protein